MNEECDESSRKKETFLNPFRSGNGGGSKWNWKDPVSPTPTRMDEDFSDVYSDGDDGGGDDNGGDLLPGFTAFQIREILHLRNADHPGMQLVAALLTGNNFLNWGKSLRRALVARSKLEFINGTLHEPHPQSRYYKQWLKIDYMVSTWIVNSISKEFVIAFIYLDSTHKLWKAITLRFGRKNGPKIYRLQKEIYKYSQGIQSVLEYFNNLVALWDKLDAVLLPLECVCHARGTIVNREEQQRLIKFLEGLNDNYEAVCDQSMMLDSLPDIEKVYSLIVQVEDRKLLNNSLVDSNNLMSMNVGQHTNNSYTKPGPF